MEKTTFGAYFMHKRQNVTLERYCHNERKKDTRGCPLESLDILVGLKPMKAAF